MKIKVGFRSGRGAFRMILTQRLGKIQNAIVAIVNVDKAFDVVLIVRKK